MSSCRATNAKDGWIIRSTSKNLTQVEPHTRVEIITGGCVVATVEPQCIDEEPDLYFVGERPFRLNRETFWAMAVRVPVGSRPDRMEHVVFEYVLMGMTLQNGARIRWFALQPRGGNAS